MEAVDAAQAGDAVAARLIELWGERVGIGIANAINTFDPEEVVIGGGAARAGELLLEPAKRTAAAYVLPGLGKRTTIRVARHGVRAGVLGAALLAAHELADSGRVPDSGSDDRPVVIVACGFDHAGYVLRERLLGVIAADGHEMLDFGTDRPDPIDYPDKALEVGAGGGLRPRRAGDHRVRLGRRRVGGGGQDPRGAGGHDPRHLHRPPGRRARRRQRAVPRRPRDRRRGGGSDRARLPPGRGVLRGAPRAPAGQGGRDRAHRGCTPRRSA